MERRDEQRAARPNVFTIPPHRSFADSLVTGLIARHGSDATALASGRILLPTNRAVRSVTEAFVRLSGGGLVLPRLVAIGDPEFDERIGGALDPVGGGDPLTPAIDPFDRRLQLARILMRDGTSASEALRLAADLARTLDQLVIEEVSPSRLRDVTEGEREELQAHWQQSLERLDAIVSAWPLILESQGKIDLTERRNRILRRAAERWRRDPPTGFTVAAGITTSAPAVAALLKTIAFMDDGAVALPALATAPAMTDEEWEALGPNEDGSAEPSHPQYHLKQLLDRMGVAREEVRLWPRRGEFASPPERSRAIVHAMALPAFTGKWQPSEKGSPGLPSKERRLPGVRHAEFADPASEALGIAIALRAVLEKEGRTAALVTPDRDLASRVSAHLERWGITADDSAGKSLSRMPAGSLLLAIASAAAERLAPVALVALLKHPLVGGEEEDRRSWLDDVRQVDLALRGPRPPAGLAGLDDLLSSKKVDEKWARLRDLVAPLDSFGRKPLSLSQIGAMLRETVEQFAGDRAWRGADGRAASEFVAELEHTPTCADLVADPLEWVALLDSLLGERTVRPPYGGHPRISIWGLIEARLQHADLLVLGSLNEGSWPALPSPDPWLAPLVRRKLGLPGLDFRIGLSGHDFASALGARNVLLTRARRDSSAPTIPSRFLLRLEAMSLGDTDRAEELEEWVRRLDTGDKAEPIHRPAPAPPAEDRPRRMSVTRVDRIKADPFAFYAKMMLGLDPLDPLDAEQSAKWRGTAIHDVFETWFKKDGCNPDKLERRALEFLGQQAIHPMVRALWQPRLIEAIRFIAGKERENQIAGRTPLEPEHDGEAEIVPGVRIHGRADRIDRLPDGTIAIVDFKTGDPPSEKAVEQGFAMQLGLLGLIGRAGGFKGIDGKPGAHEYWSLSRINGRFGKIETLDEAIGTDAFLDRTQAQFAELAAQYLTGDAPFTAKPHPAYSPFGDYDQLMRFDEWYGRE